MKIGVIGGGASGFFSAIHAAGQGTEVHLFEKSSKLLSKVKISGGGRCNVTHRPMEIGKLAKFYPRGEKFLKRVFRHFSQEDTIHWFESRGVSLKIEADGRVFPKSDRSESIIQALLNEATDRNIQIHLKAGVAGISMEGEQVRLQLSDQIWLLDRLIIATGGSPKLQGFDFLKDLGHSLVPPVPSLFTFNAPSEPIRQLMGVALPTVLIRIEGTKMSYTGPLLITHWGISGPAVLKLSAYGARWLHEQNYRAKSIINWVASNSEQDWDQEIRRINAHQGSRKVKNYPASGIPVRLWEFLMECSEIPLDQIFGELSKKQINRLVQNLFAFPIRMEGKTTFKEEFVTAGGVSLSEVDPDTMCSKRHPSIYFAGEVLDLDGITGGFNFQAAWSTGFLAGLSCRNSAKPPPNR